MSERRKQSTDASVDWEFTTTSCARVPGVGIGIGIGIDRFTRKCTDIDRSTNIELLMPKAHVIPFDPDSDSDSNPDCSHQPLANH